jgi:2-dehydropantoate 2-reductase
LGGVGGYFGGLLAKAYFDQMQSKSFFCTWRKKVIAKNGLKIIADTTEIVAFPSLVSNVPEKWKLDYLICATKTYDIETSL